MLYIQEWSYFSNYVKQIGKLCSQNSQIFLKPWRNGRAPPWGADANIGLNVLVASRLWLSWLALGGHWFTPSTEVEWEDQGR